MNRLTIYHMKGSENDGYYIHYKDRNNIEEEIFNAIQKLGEYEDIKLEPYEIAKRIAELEKELKLYQSIMCRYFFKYNNEAPTSLEEIDKFVDKILLEKENEQFKKESEYWFEEYQSLGKEDFEREEKLKQELAELKFNQNNVAIQSMQKLATNINTLITGKANQYENGVYRAYKKVLGAIEKLKGE